MDDREVHTAMSMAIFPAQPGEITRIICPECGEKVRGVGLLKNSNVTGLTFTCKRCRNLWRVESK